MGTAWGVLFCIENFGAIFFPIIQGAIHDYFINKGDTEVNAYYYVGYFWVISAFVSFIGTIVLQCNDKNFGYQLYKGFIHTEDKPPSEKPDIDKPESVVTSHRDSFSDLYEHPDMSFENY